ncbi:MAG: hypothetical protein GXP41_06915 [Chloroflexi bacterium]|nr:hypothetical protein [Chloroflexota bacterium]
MGLQFYLFSELRIVYNAATLPPALPYRLQNLLALLLLRPRLRRREQLVAVLFPAASLSQGRRRLSDQLYQLRKALPTALFVVDRKHAYLDVATRWLDVEVFRACARATEVSRWLEGVKLCRGDLLPSNYEDWLVEEREALRMRFVSLAHRLTAHLVAEQAFARALPVAEQLVRVEPYDETALRQLMRIYQALGRRGQALHIYERYQTLATDELGLAPEASTQVLAQAIRDACSLSPPHLSPQHTQSAGSQVLLTDARQALNLGQRARAEALLKQTQWQQSTADADTRRWLESDLALRFDELERAQRLLAQCDPQHPQTVRRKAELALARRQWHQAISLAEETLLLANLADNPVCEGRALWIIAGAKVRIGQRSEAYRLADRALAQARQHGTPEYAIDCLITLGRMAVWEGRLQLARNYAAEAIALAQQHSFALHYSRALRLSGWAQSRAGHLEAALATYETALTSCRNVGLPRLEARLLNESAECCDLLGMSRRSLSLLQEAEALLRQRHDPIPRAINQYNQVFTYLYLGDDQAGPAIARAQAALAVFRRQGQTHWVALGLVALGFAQWVGGYHQQALSALAESYRLHEQLREPEKLCEILALQAQVYLELGQAEEALTCSRQAVLALTQGSRATDMATEVYFARAMALLAVGDSGQAIEYLRRAYTVLIDIASALEDESARLAFFRRDPITRRLMQEVVAHGLTQPATAGQQTQWLTSRQDGYTAQVQWTVDAGPADVALKQAKGAIAVRRARLSRLIREVRQQGIHPREADLAAALGVSVRTIQRDLAYLRKKTGE